MMMFNPDTASVERNARGDGREAKNLGRMYVYKLYLYDSEYMTCVYSYECDYPY